MLSPAQEQIEEVTLLAQVLYKAVLGVQFTCRQQASGKLPIFKPGLFMEALTGGQVVPKGLARIAGGQPKADAIAELVDSATDFMQAQPKSTLRAAVAGSAPTVTPAALTVAH